jgi:hypothetical protein
VFAPSRALQLSPVTVETGNAATLLSLVCSHKSNDASQLGICMCGSWMSNLFFCQRATCVKIAISGILNCIEYCIIFIVHIILLLLYI